MNANGNGQGGTTEYREFLRSKIAVAEQTGCAEIADSDIHPILKPHQRAIVRWAVQGGRRAIFASFGLGKTVMQLEIARLILQRQGTGRALIVTPLGIRQEFTRDAAMIGQTITFIRRIEEATEDGLYMTNYESIRDGKLDPRGFDVVSLDEASILRGFGGTKTFRELMKIYEGTAHYRFVATATPSPNEYIELLAYAAYLDIMSVGEAKAQPLNAKILTPSGWKLMGEIHAGDQVVAGDGSSTVVLGVYPQGERTIYRMRFNDGTFTECDAEHLWFTKIQRERNNERQWRKRNPGRKREFGAVRTTAEIAATLRHRGGLNHSIPLVGSVEMNPATVGIAPWLLGALIGDACLRETNIVFSSNDQWMLDRVQQLLPDGLSLRITARGTCDYSITATGKQGGNGPGSNRLLNILREYNLLGKRSWEKRIPEVYLYNTADVRLGILRGLMDTDGTICRDGRMQRFCTTSPGLAEDVRWLVQSLGGIANIRRRKTTAKDAYIVAVSLPNILNPFSLPRKADRVKPKLKYPPVRFITAIELVGNKEAQCIAIDHPCRLYVTDHCLVTHNTRFFKRNSEKADALTLHPHRERDFWLWVASWAIMLQKPSDLGPDYSDDGYDLPPLDVRWHKLPSDHRVHLFARDGQGALFRSAALGVQQASQEKRLSLPNRVSKMMDIVRGAPEEHFVIWHDLEAERHAITEALPDAVEVYGTQDLDEREQRIIDFSDGKTRLLATKPILSGAGCNLQRHCHREIFLGIGFKFYEFIQSIHRCFRFLQEHPVRVDLIYTEAEEEIRKTLERKWDQHKAMMERMLGIIQEYGLAQVALASVLHRTIGVERQETTGERFHLIHDDAVFATKTLPSESVHLILTSIPFSTQYEYTPSYHDMGHNQDNAAFWQQMDFLTPDLVRVLAPGRLAVIHVKDRTIPGGVSGLGFQTLYPFHCDAIAHYQKHGLAFLGMKTIVTDVVRENNQTYRLGWSEQCKDGSKMGCGVPEYLLIFRRPPTDSSDGYADVPVLKVKPQTERSDGTVSTYDYDGGKIMTRSGYSRSRWQIDAHGFSRSNGNRLLTPEELLTIPHHMIFKRWREESLANVYNLSRHVEIAEQLEREKRLPSNFMLLPPHSWHPDVWTDVARMRTMNMLQAQKGREMHLCPMQFDIADRCILQYTSEWEVVFDPFMGLGTVPLRAIMLGRTGWGVELSGTYYLEALQHLQRALTDGAVPMLYDLLDAEDAPAVTEEAVSA